MKTVMHVYTVYLLAAGCGNGSYVLSDFCVLNYRTTDFYTIL